MTAPAYSVIPFLLSQVRTDTDALVGGSVYFYSPGTTETTGITIYLDKDGTQPANNPYTLDGDATAQLYASGSYRIVIKDVNGVTQFDRDNLYFSAGPDYVTQIAIGNYASLAAAVTAIGSDSTRLLINEAITVAADLVVPANIILERIEPGKITVNPGVTLTITAAPLSDASQWFYGTGTVIVTGYPQDQAWWGNSERIDAGGFHIKSASVLASPYSLQNVSFTASVGSKALTVALKGIDGNNPSSTNPVNIAFRSATATSATTVIRTITSATSVVLSSGSTLGFSAGATGKIYVWAIDYSGTVELALSGSVYWNQGTVVSTTAEGGAGTADSPVTLYSTTARTNIACRLLGIITIQTGATAGEWDNAPTVLSTVGDSLTGVTYDVSAGTQYYPLVSGGTAAAPSFSQLSTTGIANNAVTATKLPLVTAGTGLSAAGPTTYATHAAAIVKGSGETTYEKKWSCPSPRSGVVTLRFSMGSSSGQPVYTKIYVNGVAVDSTENSTTKASLVCSEDVTVTAGDTVELWLKAAAVGTCSVGDLTLNCTDPLKDVTETTY